MWWSAVKIIMEVELGSYTESVTGAFNPPKALYRCFSVIHEDYKWHFVLYILTDYELK